MKNDYDTPKEELIAELDRLRALLATSEDDKYRKIVEGLPQFIFELDTTGTLRYANEYALSSYGYSREDIKNGLHLSDIIHPDSYAHARESIQAILAGEPVMGREYSALRKDRTSFPVKVYSQPIIENGQQTGIRGIVVNISDIKQVEKALSKSKNYYRTLFENTGTAMTIVTADSVILTCNSQYERLSGYSCKEVEGKMYWWDFVPPEELDRMKAYHATRTLSTNGAPDNYEFTFLTRTGTHKRVHVFVGVIADTEDRVCSLIDVTERDQALHALRASDERYELMVRGANDGLWDWDLHSGAVYYSPRYKEILGYTDATFPNHVDSWHNKVHPDDLERCIKANRRCAEGKQDQFQVEFRMFHKDGSIRWILGRGGNTKDETGTPYRISGTHTDITKRKQAEHALRKSEEQYRAIFENATDGIYQCTPGGRFLTMNTALAHCLGYESPEHTMETITDIREQLWVNPEDRDVFLEELAQKGTLQNYEHHIKRKDGSRIWISENARAIYDDAGQLEYYEGFLQDITTRKFNESTTKALYAISAAITMTHDLSELYRAIHAIIKGVVHTQNFFIAEVNKKLDRMQFVYFRDEKDDYFDITGISDSTMNSLSIHVYRTGAPLRFSAARPKDVALAQDVGIIGTTPAAWLGVPLKLNGEIMGVMAVQDYANPLQYGEIDVSFMTAVSEQVAMAIERKANEESLTRLNEKLESKVDQRTAELKKQTAELENANKRLRKLDEIKSTLVSSVSHELRTPLTSIRGFAKLCAKDFARYFHPLTENMLLKDKGCRIQNNLAIIDTEGERLTRLINDFLDINRIESGKAAWHDTTLDPCAVITKATTTAFGSFAAKSGVQLISDIPASARPIHADPDKIHQILINLLNNAYKFTTRGSVTVSFQERGGSTIFSVKDTGPGIHQEELPHLFEKFHKAPLGDTLHVSDTGTGLGLAICKEIVEHYGGSIWVESSIGTGSIFSFSIPCVP
ncbi:PAS domain S-box protein [Pseudodesulfovibrio sp. JC047]|uniref:sensor histidine kinase n=1 Tax=Pseudodesulfovibrio sp. JC047 TaxID=2683199 RepID=UPI0013D2C5C1|nr:PAS domain S-box protein [Pseudodesulfovibrio sp. JC047]NDV19401.1 PAS domain S-box protein [Pseudodesulfovibrio sp. JC047]